MNELYCRRCGEIREKECPKHPDQTLEPIPEEIQHKIGEAEKKNSILDLQGYIFDESKIIRPQPFPFLKFGGMAGFGYFLYTEKTDHDKDGKEKGRKQTRVPVLICSDGKHYPLGKKFEEAFKIRVEVPSSYPDPWSLRSIEKYLRGEAETIDGKTLFKKLKELYQKYLYFQNDGWYSLHAIWDISTYFFLLFRYFPILELRGFQGTGKGKIMTLSRQITFNATDEMTNPSSSVLFRTTHELRPTTYIDEAENLFEFDKRTGKAQPDERAQMLNSGYKYTGRVPRSEKQGDKWVQRWFNSYSPKMIASINGLFGATEDRAIVHITTKAMQEDPRSRIEPDEADPIFQEIRDELYIFALQNWDKIAETYQTMDIKGNLSNRDLAIWKPLLSVARVVDPELSDQLMQMAEDQAKIKSISNIHEGSTDYKLLEIVKDFVDLGKNPIYPKEILEKWGGEYRPSSKTICRILDGIGFRDQKARRKNGTCYSISYEMFRNVVIPICPSIFPSPASFSSPHLDKRVKKGEANEDRNFKNQEKGEANEGNEANEDEIELEGSSSLSPKWKDVEVDLGIETIPMKPKDRDSHVQGA